MKTQLCTILILSFTSLEIWGKCVDIYYPPTKEPYRNIIFQIIKGIESKIDAKAHHHNINNGYQNHCQLNISLGRQSYLALRDKRNPLVIGGVLAHQGHFNHPGLSLMPRPKILFQSLINFRPSVKTIWTLYSKDSQALIAQANIDARKLNLELKTILVDSNKDAAALIRSLVVSLDGKSDALWINHDAKSLTSEATLNTILKHAWTRHYIFFSSRANHVRRGALFSVIPDYTKLGENLAIIANRCLQNNCQESKFSYLQAVKTTVNTRTAQHLNITIKEEYVDIPYPSN